MSVFLRVRNVSKDIAQRRILSDISLDINEGEVFGLLGVNGAGKTTLSSLIATLHPVTKGDILFKDNSIYNDVESYRKQIGFCPQRPTLNSNLTLRENLVRSGRYYGMSYDAIEKRLKEVADDFGLHAYLDAYSPTLSGGYQQRFLLARSVFHKPALVLLDEPTVGIDPHIRRQLWDFIKRIKEQGTSVILTTHYLDEAEMLSDRVCILHKGVVRLIDTPKNLLEQFKHGNLEDLFVEFVNEQGA